MTAATERFDAIIIGAGQSGGPLSSALARAGWKTAIIERAHAGGTCINTGCTPTKTMIASARVADVARRAAEYGVETGAVAVDFEVVRERKREMVESFRDGSERRILEPELAELIYGEAAFTGHKTVQVALRDGGARTLTAETVIINAGGRPRIPEIEGIDDVNPLTSTTVMEIDAAPRHLLILGGGAIGVEFAQMFRRFGSEVTIIQHGERILPHEDADIAGAMAEIFAEDGIEILTGSETTRAEHSPDGEITLSIDSAGGPRQVTGDALLVAAGRVPNSDRLNLDRTGLATDEQGYIPVNDRLETKAPGIYAIGDINGGPAFTHISFDDFRILRQNLLDGGNASRAGRPLPYTTFADPQLGRIGLSESQAREQGHEITVFKMPAANIARATEVGETRGLLKAVVDSRTDRILGASILCIEGGELAGALQIAMMGDLPYTALRDGIFSHPTLMESLNNLFSSPVEG